VKEGRRNVVSEPLRKMPTNKVVEWLDNQSAETLYITAVTRGGLRGGGRRFPNGTGKKARAAKMEPVPDLFKARTTGFDSLAADKLAQIAAECEKKGKRAVAPDAYIAACGAARGYAVATRNGSHFEHLGVRVIDPWL